MIRGEALQKRLSRIWSFVHPHRDLSALSPYVYTHVHIRTPKYGVHMHTLYFACPEPAWTFKGTTLDSYLLKLRRKTH